MAAWCLVLVVFAAIAFYYRSQPTGSILYEAAPFFVGLCILALVRFVSGWLSTLIMASGYQGYKTASYLLCLVVVLLISYPMAVNWGAWGVVGAYLAGYSICIFMLLFFCFRLNFSQEASV